MSRDAPDLYAVLGNPVAHSRSPAIHAAFAAQTGETIDYRRVLCPMDGFEATLRDFVKAGGRGAKSMEIIPCCGLLKKAETYYTTMKKFF
jgi:shikimate 5-dehydrogenase